MFSACISRRLELASSTVTEWSLSLARKVKEETFRSALPPFPVLVSSNID